MALPTNCPPCRQGPQGWAGAAGDICLLTQSSAILTLTGATVAASLAVPTHLWLGQGRAAAGSSVEVVPHGCCGYPLPSPQQSALSSLPQTSWEPDAPTRARSVPDSHRRRKGWKEQGSEGCHEPVGSTHGRPRKPRTRAWHCCTRSPPGRLLRGRGGKQAAEVSRPGSLLCPPGSSGPARPPLHRGGELLLIACPTCALHTALKAQIILTTVPHSSPVLFGKQPLSCCTKRSFSRSPAALGANLPAWNAGGSGRGVWVHVLCKHNARCSAVIELRRCRCQERRALCARCQLQLPLRVPAAVGFITLPTLWWPSQYQEARVGDTGAQGLCPRHSAQGLSGQWGAGRCRALSLPGKANGSPRVLEGSAGALLQLRGLRHMRHLLCV